MFGPFVRVLHSVTLLFLCYWKPINGLGWLKGTSDVLKEAHWNNTRALSTTSKSTPLSLLPRYLGNSSLYHGRKQVGSASVRSYLIGYGQQAEKALNASGSDMRDDLLPRDSLCIYKVVGQGGSARVCFRTLESSFHCNPRQCRVFKSGKSLVANVLRNSSVLLQWQPWDMQKVVSGFVMNCSWNGTYVRFQCDRVLLGSSCRDYLVTDLHDNVKYRICLQTLYLNWSASSATASDDCVEFMVEPAGMQDIVIAMTAVGGSICVMLVIICLLVAYITENLMHPTFVRSSSRRRHQDR
ncbi:fibronectin type III domain-containing protein 10 [Protopterus annectens]|uniref:fibronectin type III domain-containing protein 10 n=1 Tax=Protopterus annectens TaxID=7888 RepID=UPI001CF9A631|nr:fibronectin type III domain-containing protein 10 [Protopterus annectens]